MVNFSMSFKTRKQLRLLKSLEIMSLNKDLGKWESLGKKKSMKLRENIDNHVENLFSAQNLTESPRPTFIVVNIMPPTLLVFRCVL